MVALIESLTATGHPEVDAHYLHQVGFQQVHVPPGIRLHVGHRAGGGLEVGRGAAVDRPLGAALARRRRLHGRLAEAHVQHWSVVRISIR